MFVCLSLSVCLSVCLSHSLSISLSLSVTLSLSLSLSRSLCVSLYFVSPNGGRKTSPANLANATLYPALDGEKEGDTLEHLIPEATRYVSMFQDRLQGGGECGSLHSHVINHMTVMCSIECSGCEW